MILEKIVRHKLKEISALKKNRALFGFPAKRIKKNPKFRFSRALSSPVRFLHVIAEIKRKSPSRGIIRKNFDFLGIAREYEKSGAAALSVLTDRKFFGGSLEVLKKVRRITKLPILRKDFILDECQIYEAKRAGADAILLIAAILPAYSMKRFYELATKLGMDSIFEVHNLDEVEAVLPLKPKIIGINNRDLKTFKVDLSVTARLAKRIPKNIHLISESGIYTTDDIRRVKKLGAGSVLVGESLMREKSPGAALQRLLGDTRGSR